MNLYAISALINFITSAVLGIFVILKSRKSKNFSFFIFCFFVAFWSFFYYWWQVADNAEVALFWCRVFMAGAIFIPVAYLHFVYALVEILEKRKKFLAFSYFLFSVFLFLDFTPYFVSHVESLANFKFWPIAGTFYGVFLFLWIFYAYYAAYLLLKYYKSSTGILRLQLGYVAIGTVIGWTGGLTNYFLWYKISVPPFGNITASIYLMMIAYAILRYRLMDIRIVLKKTFIYIMSAGFAYGVFYFLVWFYNKFLGGLFTTSAYATGLFMAPIFVGTFLWFYSAIQKVANKYFFYSLYNYQETINKLSQKLNYLNDLSEIVGLIVDTVKQSMQLERAGVLLVEQKDGAIKYKIAKVVGFNEHNGISLVQDNFLTRKLEESQKPLVREELSLLAKDSANSEEKNRLLELNENMKHIEASLCLPLMSNKKLIGIMVLGSKVSRDAFTAEDLELLSTLAYQAGIAVDNARLYEQIQDLNKNLQKKVDEQTKDISQAYEIEKKAKEELQLLDKSKSQFMLVTQHHLRTPLTSVMGYLDLVLSEKFGKIPKKAKELLQKAEKSNASEIKIVNDLLSVSQFQLGKSGIQAEPGISLKEIFDEIISEIKFQADQKGLQLKVEGRAPAINADKSKLKVALANVVDNAVKYTEKGEIFIRLKAEGDKAVIAIKDTGIGMLKKDLQNLFSKTFERGKDAQKINAVGKGIGLFLTAKIIEAHKGKIWAESEGSGKGSSFIIELPA